MNKSVLIIGGSYFIGKSIAENLFDKGYNVTLLNRGTREPFNKQIKQISCDRGNFEEMKKALENKTFDYIVETSFYDISWSKVLLKSFKNILNAKAFIFISSSAVYDVENLTIPFSETDSLAKNKYWTEYGTGKLETEKLYTNFFKNTNVRLIILRPPYVYGEENYAQRESFIFNNIINNIPVIIPITNFKLQFIYSKDLAKIVEYFINENNEKLVICNVGNKDALTCKQWVEACSEAAEKKAEIIMFDYKKHNYAIRDFFPFFDYDNVLNVEKINERISVETDFVQGLKNSFNWFYKNKNKIEFKVNVEENIQKILKKIKL